MARRDNYPDDPGEWVTVDAEDGSPLTVEHFPLRANGRPRRTFDFQIAGLPHIEACLRAIHKHKYEADGAGATWTPRLKTL